MAKILHVDPLPLSRQHVAEVLTAVGHEVVSTDGPSSVGAGLEFDLEIWAGSDLLEAAHRQPEPSRKILLFAHSGWDRTYAEKNGVPFLSKFSDGAVLAQTVARLLAKE